MLLNKYVRYTRLSLVLSFRPMAPHIVTSGGDGHTTSPVLSSTPSFVSARSILSDLPERSPGVQDTFHVAQSHQIQGVRSLVIELSGGRKPTSTYGEGSTSFVRHHKYFFPDGNTTFLVRRFYHDDGVYRLLIVQAVQVEGTLYCIHRYFFSRDSAYFSTQFSQFYIHDHDVSHTIISLADIERKDFDAFLSILYPEYGWRSVVHEFTYQGVSTSEILGRPTSLTKSGNPCFTSQHVGASLRFAGWHWRL